MLFHTCSRPTSNKASTVPDVAPHHRPARTGECAEAAVKRRRSVLPTLRCLALLVLLMVLATLLILLLLGGA